nr:retrovirus-related Pol polyprotein from transposon TNT 1-94 [Tanacetum cinerariifolium]
IPLLNRGEYSQWSEKFMNYLDEQIDGEAMINSIRNGDQPFPRVTQVSIAGTLSTEQPPLKDKSMWSNQEKKIQKIDRLARPLLIQGLSNDIYSLIDSNKTAKYLWDALASELKKGTALLAKDFNRMKFYSKPTNNNLRTSSTSNSAKKKQEYVKSDEKKEDKKVEEKKRDMSKVKCYNCKKEGHFAKDCKKAKVKDYEYYKTKMFLKVLLDSEKRSSSSDETIDEVSYYTSKSESKSEYETSEYYDNSTNYGLFVNNDDDQEIFHDSSEFFFESHIGLQMDHDRLAVDHNDSEETANLINQMIKEFDKKIAKYQKRLEKANQQNKDFENQNKDLQDKYDKFKRARENKIEFAYDYGNLKANYVNEKINFLDDYIQEIINTDFEKNDSPFEQTSSLKPYVSNVILEKIIIDLEDEVVSLLDKEKEKSKTIEFLKTKGIESSENANSKSKNQNENDCHVVENVCDNEENPKVIALGMFKLSVSQSVSPIYVTKTSCASNSVETKLKRKRRKRTSSKHNVNQVNSVVSHANKDFVHFSDLDTFGSVRRPKSSDVIWKKKGSSDTVKADLSSINYSNLNKNIVQIYLWIINLGCSKHMASNRALLMNIVEKFLGTVHFGNNDFAMIAGYGDAVIRSMTINRVYYVEGLGHNLFSVGQFCDKGFEVAFRKSACFVRNENGVDFLTGDCSSNLYTIALNEIASNSPSYLLAKDSSSQSWLWHQHEASEVIISFIKKTQVNLQLQVQRIRIDNGTKFKNKTLATFFDEVRISQQFSAARTPQQNGVVERRNRTLVEAARTMLTFANIPLFLWAEAIATTCFTQNHLIIYKRFDKTPYELINKRKPNIKFFHVFGCRCYLLNDYDDVGKLKAKGDIGVFVGYSKDYAAFRSISNDMIPNVDEASSSHNGFNERLEDSYFDASITFYDTSYVHTYYQPYPHETKWTKNHPLHQIISDPKSSVCTRGQLENSCLFACLLSSIEPANVAEALKDADWVIAMQEELDQCARLKVWRLVPKPESKTIIKTKWNFKNKKDENVKTTFLNDILKEEVYVAQPLGFVSKQYPYHVYALYKALYGLKQAPRAWMKNYDTISTPMVEQAKLKLDLVRKPVDHTVYQSMIGSLMYLPSSRLDIMFATCLWYPKDSGFDLTAYSDADHAGCHLDRKKFKDVVVFNYCARVLWMRNQLTNYGFFYDRVPVYCNSKSAIEILFNPVHHTQTKHIDVRYHFIKDHVEKGSIELYFVGTEYQLADLFMKSLPEARLKFLVEKLGMTTIIFVGLRELMDYFRGVCLEIKGENVWILILISWTLKDILHLEFKLEAYMVMMLSLKFKYGEIC